MDVSVRELKSRLSEYLRRARAGEEVHVTLRGRRVARLVAEAPDAEPEQAALQRLDAQPWITRPAEAGRPVGLAEPPRIAAGEKVLADFVSEDRG